MNMLVVKDVPQVDQFGVIDPDQERESGDDTEDEGRNDGLEKRGKRIVGYRDIVPKAGKRSGSRDTNDR